MNTYQLPFKGKYGLGTLYGTKGNMWACGWHTGIDFYSQSAGGNGYVYPVCEGVVERITSMDKSYGNCIRVRHSDGYMSLYAHLKYFRVMTGQAVTQNTVIGIEGNTGNTTATHLHLEIHNGAYHYPASIDPLKFLQERMMPMTVEEAKAIIKAKAGLSDATITYLWSYRYGDELLLKLAEAMK